MMTFEGTQLSGVEAIMGKLRSVGQVRHTILSLDVQPTIQSPGDVQPSVNSQIAIVIMGSIRIGGGEPLLFSEMFLLVSTEPGQYYVHNGMFRLNN